MFQNGTIMENKYLDNEKCCFPYLAHTFTINFTLIFAKIIYQLVLISMESNKVI